MSNAAIVIGGTRRTGRWISEALCVQGYTVHALYRSDTTAANQYAAEMTAAGYSLHAHQADATDGNVLSACVQSIAAEHNGIKVLVNSTGLAARGSLIGTSAGQLETVWRSNVMTVHNAVLAAVPFLRLQGGWIINFLSVGTDTQRAFRQVPAYAACKAMLASYSRSLARELASDGITVNCIALGATDMDAENVPDIDPELLPAGRLVSQEDVAAALWYLTGPGSGQTTGTVLNLSGGWAL